VTAVSLWDDSAFLDDQADQEGAEVGVIVVAENPDICDEALKALVVEWEELPFVVDLRKGRRRTPAPARLPLREKAAVAASEWEEATIPQERKRLLFQYE